MLRLASLLPLALMACATRPTDQGEVNAALDGHVLVTGPVAGAVVSAYALDVEDGSAAELVATSMPSDDGGAFHIDLGNHHGPLLLVAKGAGAKYIEPATGLTVTWDASTQLQAVYLKRAADQSLAFDLDSGENGSSVISPWSDWAYAYSLARGAAHRDASYADGLTQAVGRFRDHTELDFWAVVPTVMSDGPVGAWNTAVQAGVLLAALSNLSATMAHDSQLSPAGLSSLQLLAQLRDDLHDAVLDGIGTQGALTVGTCPLICKLGPLTLRGDLSSGGTAFLASPSNKSGIAPSDAALFLGRVSARVSDLWPTEAAPTVSVIASSFEDDDGVTASVAGAGVGVIAYQGTGHAIVLAAGNTPSFVKFPGRYGGDASNLPEWHFKVSDADTADGDITLLARLSRVNASGETVVLADWFPVSAAAGADYNRVLPISTALSTEVGIVSGKFILEFQAHDGHDHLSRLDCAAGVGCVTWQQTILPPPLRQRAGSDDPVCSDLEIPTGHGLTTSSCGNTFAFTAIANLTDTRKISLGFIDNPNPAPVQVTIAASAPTFVRRGLRFENIHVATPRGTLETCNEGIDPQLPNGTCFTPSPAMAEYGTDEVLDRDLAADVEVAGATLLGPTGGTGPVIYEIPALSTATVWIDSQAWGFLLPGPAAYYPTLGTEMNLTATTARHWLQCNMVIRIPPNNPDGVELCSLQWDMLETTSLTRVAVRPTSSVSLTARPGGSDESLWAPATGTNVSSFRYHDFRWETQMPGYGGL